MEKNLEHKIKEAIQRKDEQVKYPSKDELWTRIVKSRNEKRGVSAFWRIAAILFALFFITGAFAGIMTISKSQNLNNELSNENIRLKHHLDSLQNIQPETITETKIVEKEVPVYIRSERQAENSDMDKIVIEELRNRNSSLQIQISNEREKFQNEIDSLKNELQALKTEIQISTATVQTNKEPDVIELKSENYDTLYQQKPSAESPKIKLQLFNNPAQQEKIQINSSIFKQ